MMMIIAPDGRPDDGESRAEQSRVGEGRGEKLINHCFASGYSLARSLQVLPRRRSRCRSRRSSPSVKDASNKASWRERNGNACQVADLGLVRYKKEGNFTCVPPRCRVTSV